MRSDQQKRSGVLCAAATVLGVLAILALLPGRASYVTPARAQGVHVNWGEGQYGRYQHQMVDFVTQEEELEKRINNLVIFSTYCKGGHPSLAEVRAELQTLHNDYNALRNKYLKYRQGLSRLAADHPSMLTGFDMSQMTPENPNFWVIPNRLMSQPAALLRQKDSQLAKAKEVDCSQKPKTTAHTTGPTVTPQPAEQPKPQWPTIPASNPLTQSRPTIDVPPVPTLPKRFCSAQEKWDYYNKVIKPVYERADKAVAAALQYRSDLAWKAMKLSHKIYDLKYESKSGTANPHLIAELTRQLKIVDAEAKAWEPIALHARDVFDRFSKLIDQLLHMPVVDCTPPPPPPPVHTGGFGSNLVAPPPPVLTTLPRPGKFCTREARDAYLKRLDKLIDRARTSVDAWASYKAALDTPRTGEQQDLDTLDRQLDDADKNLSRARDNLQSLEELRRKISHTKISECGEQKSDTGFKLHIGIGIGIGNDHWGGREDRRKHDRRGRSEHRRERRNGQQRERPKTEPRQEQQPQEQEEMPR
jgi:hypothetical protein